MTSKYFCKHIRSISLLFVIATFNGALSRACIHPPEKYDDVVTEKTKEAFAWHDGQNAHLIIKTNVQAAKELPSEMAWVIPLPSLPSHYEEVDAALFKELFALTPEPLSKDLIKVHDKQFVGNYEIQPIEIVSEEAGDELNAWLTQNGFGTVPIENQKPYLKKGTVFLALKIKNLSGAQADIKPLHIVYPADAITLPLKFSSHSGVFDVVFYVFSQKPMSLKALDKWFLTGRPPEQLRFRPETPNYDKLIGRVGYLTRFTGSGFNGNDKLVKNLPSDPTISAEVLNGKPPDTTK